MLPTERLRIWLLICGIVAGIGGGAVVYPHLLEMALARFGVRAVSGALLALALASIAISRVGPLAGRGTLGLFASGISPAWGFPLLLAAAAFSDDARILMLIPAWVYISLASIFQASLRRPDSLIERGARSFAPYIPEFVRPYCRGLTAMWAIFFLLNAGAIAWLAFAAAPQRWRAYTGGWIFTQMLAITCVEFFVRKTWFRYYYHGGIFDRVWSRLFPAENTAFGRASLEYIARYRAQQAGRAATRPDA